jgi:hypothetical protein
VTLFVWPWRLLTPAGVRWAPPGDVITGPPGMDGQVQAVSTDGGGRWSAVFGGISLYDEDRVLAARAWAAHLRRGLVNCVVPNLDLRRAPRPSAGGDPALPSLPPAAPPGDWFGWEPGFGISMMVAKLAAPAALRATTLVIVMTRGGALRGGQHFSLNGPVKGWRLYRIVRVVAVADTTFTCIIHPPLREAAAGGLAVELDVPRCTMKLIADKADALEPSLELDQGGEVEAHFEEAN